jgi:hypothetical protein
MVAGAARAQAVEETSRTEVLQGPGGVPLIATHSRIGAPRRGDLSGQQNGAAFGGRGTIRRAWAVAGRQTRWTRRCHWCAASRNGRPLLVVDAANTRPAHRRMVSVAVMTANGTSSRGGTPPVRPDAEPALAPRRDGTLALRDVAAFFGRKLVPAGSVSVLAPDTMVVLNPRPGKPDLFAGLSREERLRMLLASLSPAEWRRLGDPNGLGAGDLATPAQRRLFLSLLPDPLTVQKRFVPGHANTPDDERGYGPNHRDFGPTQASRVTLSPGQRAAVRLAFVRRATVYVPLPPDPAHANTYRFRVVEPWSRQRSDEGSFLEIATNFADAFRDGRTRTEAYGVVLRDEVPSRAKPGDLPFDSARLNPMISLESGNTVGDLVNAAGKACQLELYADARLAPLSVTLVGDTQPLSVRAGDLLRALSLAVTGTFRRVTDGDETAWVLTDDVDGLGTRQARLSAWVRTVGAQDDAERDALLRRIVAQKPDQYVGFAPGDPHALPPSVMDRLTANTKPERTIHAPARSGRGRERSRPAARLPADGARSGDPRDASRRRRAPFQRQRPEDRDESGWCACSHQTGSSHPRRGPPSRTQASLPVSTTTCPTTWNAVGSVIPAAPRRPPPKTRRPPPNLSGLPAAIATRALIVRPDAPSQAAALVREAKQRGFNQLWLALPDALGSGEPNDTALLKAALQAGKETGIAVVAVAPLLRRHAAPPRENNPATAQEAPIAVNANESDAAAQILDRNIVGETRRQEALRGAEAEGSASDDWRRWRQVRLRTMGDLLRIDAPEVTARLRSRLSALAQTPGLAGLAFDDTAAPGYEDPGTNDPTRYDYQGVGGFGFTPGLRLRFLRQASIDPVDLNAESRGGVLEVPFLPGPQRTFPGRSANGSGSNVPQTNPARTWAALRFETNRRFLADLYAGLRRDARPDLPLFLAERGSGEMGPTWFGLWERPDALPRLDWASSGGAPPSPQQQARRFSSRNLMRIAPWLGEERFPPWLMKDLPTPLKGWDGVVFDLRDLSGEAALALLKDRFAPVATNSGN